MLAVLLVALESDEDRQKFIETFEQYHARMERTAKDSLYYEEAECQQSDNWAKGSIQKRKCGGLGRV